VLTLHLLLMACRYDVPLVADIHFQLVVASIAGRNWERLSNTKNVLTLHLFLMACRYDVPLVADIHFQPVVASMVAECFEKIRVNPGNFVDGRKRFDEKVYDDDSQFKQEQEHIREVRRSVFIIFQSC